MSHMLRWISPHPVLLPSLPVCFLVIFMMPLPNKGTRKAAPSVFPELYFTIKDKDYFLQRNNKIFHSLILTDLWSLSANCIFWYFNLSLLQTLCSLGCYYLLFIMIV